MSSPSNSLSPISSPEIEDGELMCETPKPKVNMMEYFRCKRCYTDIPMHRIPRHHTLVHKNVPHEQYLDKFFNLNRPLVKCKFCPTKLRPKQFDKHMRRAHPGKDKGMNEDRDKSPKVEEPGAIIELSSDSDYSPKAKKSKQVMFDRAVQCEPDEDSVAKDRFEDKCVGATCDMKEVAVNTVGPSNTNVGVQTDQSKNDKSNSPKERSSLSLEYDEDGFPELVFTGRFYR